jgi:hypothetical protein
MKKVYDIKISDLKNLLNLLNNFETDPMVQIDIFRLNNYINRLKNNFSDSKLSTYERLLSDVEDFCFFKPVYPFSNYFSSIGRTQNKLNFNTKYTPIKLTDMQVMRDAEDFFGEQGDFFYDSFSDFKNEAEDHLKFINPKSNTAGETLTLKSTGDSFVFVPNYSNISKFTVLVHELEHTIDFFNNQSFLENHLINETSSVFMELLACDFIAKRYNLYDDNFQRRNFLHTLIKSQGTILKDKVQMLDLVNQYKHLEEKELFSFLAKKDFIREDIEFYLEATITQDSAYQLPYLIAVELYIIYHQDKNLALTILKDIIINGNNYNIFDVLNKYGIKLNNNILFYEDCLYKKITL